MKFLHDKKILDVIKIVITIGILYFLVTYIDLDNIREALFNGDIIYILLALFLLPINLLMQFYRWKTLLHHFENISDNNKIWRSLFNGISTGIITPLLIGEYLGRGFTFHKLGYPKIALITFIDKIVPLIILLITGGIVTQYYISIYYPEYVFYSLLILSCILLLVIVLFFLRGTFSNLSCKFFPSLKSTLEIIALNNTSNKKVISKISFFSSIFILTYLVQFALLITAFSGLNFSMDFIGIALVVMFAKTIIPPITIADLGLRETLSVLFFAEIGISEAAAFNAALILFSINILIPAVSGIPFLKEAK